MSNKIRVNVYLDREVVSKLRDLAGKYGMSLTGVTGLAVLSGVDVLTLVKNPDFVSVMEGYIQNEVKNGLATNGRSGSKQS